MNKKIKLNHQCFCWKSGIVYDKIISLESNAIAAISGEWFQYMERGMYEF